MLKKPLEISVPYIKGNAKKYLNECIDSNFVSTVGPFVNLFEQAIADLLSIEAKMVCATSSGTSALQLSLLALGLKKDDIVIIPSYTFIATANAISNAGGKPWIIDIYRNTLTIDTNLIREEIQKNTFVSNGEVIHKKSKKRVFGIIPVHVFGYPPDLDNIYKIGNEYNLKIISDAAGGLGSTYKNKSLGKSIPHGVISFNGNKIITTGGGGLFFSENIELVAKVRHLASTARKTTDYIHDEIGFNYKMSNLHAALGLSQVECFKYILERKKEITNLYKHYLLINHNIHFLEPQNYGLSSNWLNAILIKDKISFDLNKFITFIQEHKINIRHYWRPIHLQPPYFNCPKSTQIISTDVYKKIIVLPSSTCITDDEIKFVSEKVINYLKDYD